jgi:CheY-like chemotaxis protein
MTLTFPPGHQHVDAGLLADDLALPHERSGGTSPRSDSVLAGVQILVVNGNSQTCVHLQTLLGAAGATVICAYDLDTVLATIARTPPDLVLVDLDEPSADPHQSIRQVRLHERNKTLLTRLPAIALGVRGAPSDVRAALQAGFDEHLAKPYTSAELVGLVASQVLRR